MASRPGTLLWKKPLQVTSTRDAFNSGSSPIIVEDMAIVQDDRDRGSSIAAYRLPDGGEVWRVSRDDGQSQGTPVVWTDGTRRADTADSRRGTVRSCPRSAHRQAGVEVRAEGRHGFRVPSHRRRRGDLLRRG